MADRNVKVTVRADVADFLRNMGLAADAAEKVGKKAKDTGNEAKSGLSGLAQSARDNREAWSVTGGALTAYGAAVTGLSAVVVRTGIEYNTLRQRSVAALATLTGSAEDANRQMDRLDDFASNSPFARDVFIRAQQQLMGFGFEAEKVVPILDAIQNAVAATGGTNHDIEELVRIIAQVGAAGKITATDLMQFGQRGVDAATLIGSQMGKTGAQIREEITAGTLGADEAIAALVAGMDERFGGAAANVKGTMDGAVDRVKAAFRDISASFASVLVDPEGGGLLVDGLNRLADAMRVFEDLPAPIRNTVMALGGISGVAALAAGGFFLLAPRLVETRDAVATLAQDMPRFSGAMRGLGRAVGAGSIAMAGLGTLGALLGAIRDASSEAIPGIEGVGDALLDLSDTGSFTSLDEQIADLNIQVNGLSGMAEGPISDLHGAFSRLADPSLTQRLEFLDKVVSFGQMRTSQDDVEDYFRSVDGFIANLATGGNVDQAVALLDQLWEAASGAGMDREQFDQLFFTAREAIQGIENDARLAAEAADEMNGAFVRLPDGVFEEKAQALYDSAHTALQGFIDLSQGVDDAELSFEGWIRSLEEQAAAQEQWAENMAALARAGVEDGFLAELEKLGPQGAVRVQQAVDAIAADPTTVDRMNELGSAMGGATVDGLAEEIRNAQLPEVEVRANTEKAFEFTQEFFERTEEETPTVTVDADTTPAENKTGIFLDTTDQSVGTPRLDLYVNPATGKLESFLTTADGSTGTPTLDADKGPADRVRDSWVATTNNTTATVGIHAQVLSSAYQSVRNFLSWTGGQSASVRVGGRVPNSFAEGGFTGPGLKYEPAGIVHRGEWVSTQETTADPWNRRFLEWMHAGHSMRELFGYASGGMVGAPTAASPATALSLNGVHVEGQLELRNGEAWMVGMLRTSTGVKREMARQQPGRTVMTGGSR